MQTISQRAHGPAFAIKAVKQHAVWLEEKRKREDKPVLAWMKNKPQDEIHQASLCLLAEKTECTVADAPRSLHMKLNRSKEDRKMATGFKAIGVTRASL